MCRTWQIIFAQSYVKLHTWAQRKAERVDNKLQSLDEHIEKNQINAISARHVLWKFLIDTTWTKLLFYNVLHVWSKSVTKVQNISTQSTVAYIHYNENQT